MSTINTGDSADRRTKGSLHRDGSASGGATQRNRYGYLLDDLRQPKCPHCGKSTNKAYREMPDLKCWNCGHEMTPNDELSDREK